MPNDMPVFIADGGKLNAVGKGTIANTLTEWGVDVNFHDHGCRIIAPDSYRSGHTSKRC